MLKPLTSPSARAGPRCRSLDDFIRPLQQRRRDREPQRLRGLEVDQQLELRWLLDREVGGLGTLEDLVHVGCGAAEVIGEGWSVGHQTAALRPLTIREETWQPSPGHEVHESTSIAVRRRRICDKERLDAGAVD